MKDIQTSIATAETDQQEASNQATETAYKFQRMFEEVSGAIFWLNG